jgi:hypothetical protein
MCLLEAYAAECRFSRGISFQLVVLHRQTSTAIAQDQRIPEHLRTSTNTNSKPLGAMKANGEGSQDVNRDKRS